MATCAGCNMAIHGKNYLTCPNCKQKYDLNCAGISSSKFGLMTQDNKRNWKCTECICKQPKSDNSNTPVRCTEDQHKEDIDITFLSAGCPNVTKRKTVKKVIGQENLEDHEGHSNANLRELIRDTFTELFSEDLSGIKKQLTEFKESLKFFNKIVEDLKKVNSDLRKAHGIMSTDVRALKEENVVLKQELKACETRVKRLEEDNSRQRQWTRLQNVEIVGVPEYKDEITLETASKVIKYFGVAIELKDIEFAHRVQPRRATSAKKGRAIVVRVRDRALRDKIIAAARKRRNTSANEMGFGGENGYIYINEHLTIENKALLASCKTKAKELNYKYVWTKNCRIYMRRNDSSPLIPISSALDLEKFA